MAGLRSDGTGEKRKGYSGGRGEVENKRKGYSGGRGEVENNREE